MTICKTVGDLKAALAPYPDDMQLLSEGPDSGGYDVEAKFAVQVVRSKTGPSLYVAGAGPGDEE